MDVVIGIITGREDRTHRGRTLPTRMLQVMLRDDSDIQTVQLVSPFGDECNPPDGSTVMVNQAGTAYKVGVSMEDVISPILAPGGRRIYSTAGDGSEVVAEVRLDPDGKVSVTGAGGSVVIGVDGIMTLTPVTKLVVNSDVEITGTLVAGGVNMNTHTHPDAHGGYTGGPV